ncbi:MAG: hypothetical protein KME29_11290 [Calothrix sp. FI2-JRJ7]|jgi:preprotein translocase subunit SecD|nr:hypothetical protein [Calothrix sp. FI2-JRJ7]
MFKRNVLVSIILSSTVLLDTCIGASQASNTTAQLAQNANSSQLLVKLVSKPGVKIDQKTLANVRSVIEKRLIGLGIKGISVQTQGTDRIIVQVPNNTNASQMQRLLSPTSLLEFKNQKQGTETQLFTYIAARSELNAKLEKLPKSEKTAIAKVQQQLLKNSQAIEKLFESTKPPFTNEYIIDAQGQPMQGTSWEIAIKFNSSGAQKFATLTKNLAGTGRSLGIFIDKQLVSYPSVAVQFAEEGITGGSAVITGNFTSQQAQDLALQLRSGAYPVPVTVQIIK